MFWLWALAVAVSPDLPGYVLPQQSDGAVIQAVTGNGRLTAGIDSLGNLAQLRWPSLGAGEHVAYAPQGDSHQPNGAGWVLVEDGRPVTFDPANWTIGQSTDRRGVLSTHAVEKIGARRVEQRIYVGAGIDVLVAELVLEGFPPGTTCFWYQHLVPAAPHGAGIPDGYPGKDRLGGFGTYVDPADATLVQFRPRAPQRADWSLVDQLERTRATSLAWTVFGEGAYWVTFSPTGIQSVRCASDAWTVEELLVEQDNGPGVAGSGHGILQLHPQNQSATRQRFLICVAAASSVGELTALRHQILESGLPPVSPYPPVRPLETEHQEAISAVLACIDQASGAVLRAPLTEPTLAHAAVFDSAWASAALDAQGYSGLAERALRFHLKTLDDSFQSSGAPGSLPAYVDTRGENIHYLDGANPAATAWLLAALWRHAATGPREEIVPLLEEWKGALEDGGDYLARDPVVGGVLAGTLKAPAAPLAMLQTCYLGLVSARALLATMGMDEPGHWRDRREETYARIRFRQLGTSRSREAESPWVALWVSTVQPTALSDDGAWEVLRSASPIDIESYLHGSGDDGMLVGRNIPVALYGALAALDLL